MEGVIHKLRDSINIKMHLIETSTAWHVIEHRNQPKQSIKYRVALTGALERHHRTLFSDPNT